MKPIFKKGCEYFIYFHAQEEVYANFWLPKKLSMQIKAHIDSNLLEMEAAIQTEHLRDIVIIDYKEIK